MQLMEYRERYSKGLSERDLPTHTESKSLLVDDRTKEFHSMDSLLPWEIPSTDYHVKARSTTGYDQLSPPATSTNETVAASSSSSTIIDPLRLFESKRMAALARLAERQQQKATERSSTLINDRSMESIDIASTSSSRIRPIIPSLSDEES
jgi:hypothetical protein